MAGNISISTGSERGYINVLPKNMSINGVMMPGNNQDIKADGFYKFGELGYLYVKLIDSSQSAFREHIFEFTAGLDNMSLTIKSNNPVYWVEPITFTLGHLYQVHVVNGIVTWLEVTPG